MRGPVEPDTLVDVSHFPRNWDIRSCAARRALDRSPVTGRLAERATCQIARYDRATYRCESQAHCSKPLHETCVAARVLSGGAVVRPVAMQRPLHPGGYSGISFVRSTLRRNALCVDR